MTAEGDNSVLMQKVAKERLAAFKPLPVDQSLPADVQSRAFLHDLLKRRENTLFKVLGVFCFMYFFFYFHFCLILCLVC